MPVAMWNGQIGSTGKQDTGWTGLRMFMTADQSGYLPMKIQWDE